MSVYNDGLYHHGVKGMKWGHRKDKGYSYTTNEKGDFVLKKGSNIKRYTDDNKEKNQGYEYASFTKRDTEMYKGDWISMLEYTSTKADVKTFQMTQKLTKDLVAPSDITKVKTILKMLNADKRLASDVNNVYEMDIRPDDNADRRVTELYRKMHDRGLPDNLSKIYSVFSMSLNYSPEIRDKFFKELSDSGYNMVIDTEDSGNYAQAPIIVFNRKDTLKLINIKEMPKKYSDEYENIDHRKIARDKKLDTSLKGFN